MVKNFDNTEGEKIILSNETDYCFSSCRILKKKTVNSQQTLWFSNILSEPKEI